MKLVPIFIVLDVVGIIVLVIVVARRRQQAHEVGPRREDRGLRKLKPFFRRDVVDRKIASLFSDTERSEAVRLLSSDLPITFGVERLQLALLKLSDGNLAELRRLVELVTSDAAQFTHVIGQAEWPEAERMGDEYVKLLPEEQEPIFRRDLRQYLRWVKR